MASVQLEKLIHQKTKGLPEGILREVLDFVEFLRSKSAKKEPDSLKYSLSELNEKETIHLEEEFNDYRQK